MLLLSCTNEPRLHSRLRGFHDLGFCGPQWRVGEGRCWNPQSPAIRRSSNSIVCWANSLSLSRPHKIPKRTALADLVACDHAARFDVVWYADAHRHLGRRRLVRVGSVAGIGACAESGLAAPAKERINSTSATGREQTWSRCAPSRALVDNRSSFGSSAWLPAFAGLSG